MKQKLLGHRLPGTGKLYLHNGDGRLRDAVSRLEQFTAEADAQVPLLPVTATS